MLILIIFKIIWGFFFSKSKISKISQNSMG